MPAQTLAIRLTTANATVAGSLGNRDRGSEHFEGQPGAVSGDLTLWHIVTSASRLEMARMGSNASSDTRYPSHNGKRDSCRQPGEPGPRVRALRRSARRRVGGPN